MPQPRPNDRSHILTEQANPRTGDLHRLSVAQLVERITQEDLAVFDAMTRARPALTALIERAEPGFLADGRLIYIGAGTSGRLGVLDASEAPPTFHVPEGKIIGIIAGGDAALRRSSESKEDDPHGAVEALAALNLTGRDTLVGIAAGGTTPYVLGALRFARSLPDPPATALITCTSPDTLPERPAADVIVVLDAGPEVLTGSTRMKAGTATKLALNTLSTTLMIRAGRVYGNLMVDMKATNDKLRDRAARIVMRLTDLPREQAFTLLDEAGGHVKTAVVMHRRNLTRDQAEQRLRQCAGRLDRALGDATE